MIDSVESREREKKGREGRKRGGKYRSRVKTSLIIPPPPLFGSSWERGGDRRESKK